MQSLLTSVPFLAFLVPLIALWDQLKELCTKLIRLLIVEVKIDGDAARAVTYWLAAHGKSLPTNIVRYDTQSDYVITKKKVRLVLFQILAGLKSQLFWVRGTLVSLSDLRGKDKETDMQVDLSSSLRFVRGTLDYEKLVVDAVNWYESKWDDRTAKQAATRFGICRRMGNAGQTSENPHRYDSSPSEKNAAVNREMSARINESADHNRLVNYRREELGYSKKEFFYVFNETTQRIHDDVDRWLKSKEWHEQRGLLHRRGGLLWGPPGSGKTAAIRKVAQKLDLPIYLFELNTMTDSDFIHSWDSSAGNGPCIIVFEDIDCTFKKRENISKTSKLSFECVLNCISGVQPAEGVYLFVTTNRLDYLDEALGIPDPNGVSTRPGRLDTCFEIGQIDEKQKREIAAHFLTEYPEIIESLIESSNGCTAAQFNDLCSQKALALYWSKS